MSVRFLALALAALAPLAARADDVDPEPKSKTKGVEGSWVFVKAIGDKGGPPPGDLVLKFAKGKVSVSFMGRGDKAHSYKIDPKKKPAHIDLTDDNGKTIAGIYKIEKGELYVCIGERSGKRPTDFAGKDETVIVLKRQKK